MFADLVKRGCQPDMLALSFHEVVDSDLADQPSNRWDTFWCFEMPMASLDEARKA